MALEDDIRNAVKDAGGEVSEIWVDNDPVGVELMDLEMEITQNAARNLRAMGYAVEVTERDCFEILGLPDA
jgi:hypothetical protein